MNLPSLHALFAFLGAALEGASKSVETRNGRRLARKRAARGKVRIHRYYDRSGDRTDRPAITPAVMTQYHQLCTRVRRARLAERRAANAWAGRLRLERLRAAHAAAA